MRTAILALDPRFTSSTGSILNIDVNGIRYDTITIDLGVNEDITTNVGTMSNSGSHTAVYMVMRDGAPNVPGVGEATSISLTFTSSLPTRTRQTFTVTIAGARVGSATSAADIAALFASASLNNQIGTFGAFGALFIADATGATNTFRYTVPFFEDTTAADFTFTVDNGTGDGDLAVSATTNTVMGVDSQLDELVESSAVYSDVTFYDLQRGTHHHLLVPTMALGGASPLFLVLDVDSNITFPWDSSGQAGDVYYSESPISVFGTDYTDFRFTTAYGPDHSIPGGSHIHARGSRVQ